MANYSQQTRDKVRKQFASVAPAEASGGFKVGLTARPAQQSQTPRQSSNFFQNLGNSLGEFAGGVGQFVAGVGQEVGRQFQNVASGITTALTGDQRLSELNRSSEVNSERAEMLIKSYRAGNLTREQFESEMKDVNQTYSQIQQDTNVLQQETDIESQRQFVIDAFSVGLTPFVFGKLAPTKAGGATSSIVSKLPGEGVKRVYGEVAPKTMAAARHIEEIASHIPSLRGALTGQAKAGTVPGNIVAGLIKKPLLLDTTVKEPFEIIDAAARGEYGRAFIGAALLSTGYFKGGPIGLGIDVSKKVGDKASKLMFGKATFFDELAKVGKLKDNPIEWLEDMKINNPQEYARNLKTAKLIEAFNLGHFEGDVRAAVQNVVEWQFSRGRPLSTMTSKELFDDLNAWHDAYSTIIAAAKGGRLRYNGEKIELNDINRVGVGAFDKASKYNLVEVLKGAKSADERMQMVQSMIDEGVQWSQNPNVRAMVMMAARSDDFAKQILSVNTGQGLKIKGGAELPNGYFPILLGRNAKLFKPELLDEFAKTSSEDEVGDLFGKAFDSRPLERGQEPASVFATIGYALERMGLSTRDQNTLVYQAVQRNLANNLTEAKVQIPKEIGSVERDIDVILKKLSAITDEKKQVFDIRQLYAKEISQALGVSTDEAKRIRSAIVDAYLKVPLQLRGLGNKIMDLNIAYNPVARAYSRAQSAGRYVYNPFFRTQEVFETEIFSQLYSGGKKLQLPGVNALSNLFRMDRSRLEDTVKKLEVTGIFDRAGRRLAETNSDVLLGNITAKMSYSQKISLAGMLERIAKKNGKDVDTYLRENGEEVADVMRMIVQYPRKSVLNSSLATTLNLAVFPTRYNIKVAGMVADVMSKQQPIVQIAMINSLMDFGDWLNSDEGKAWQSRHAEAIGIFKYLTPINSIETIYKAFTGRIESAQDLGLLGGLPFGVIGTIMEHQGLVTLGTPYLNPKTGEVTPEYIPETAKARAKQALDDLLMSVFTYPGRTLGLPGKTETFTDFTNNLWQVDKNDEFTKRIRTDLTPAQMDTQRVLRAQKTSNVPVQSPEVGGNPYQTWAILPAQTFTPRAKRPDAPVLGARSVKPKRGNAAPKKKVYARPIPQ